MKKVGLNKTQSGRSMIEMLGVLSIVGVLSVAGISGYSKAMSKYKVAKAIDQVYQITTNLQRMFGAQYGYKELASDAVGVASDIGAFPEEMLKSGTPTNAFNGAVALGTVTVDGRANGGFALRFDGLPADAVTALSRIPWDGGSNTLLSISLGESGASLPTEPGSTKEIAISDLSSVNSGNNNSITWVYK